MKLKKVSIICNVKLGFVFASDQGKINRKTYKGISTFI